MNAIDLALTAPAPSGSWHVALVRLTLVALPLGLLAAIFHAL
jgi:hypothetical protein